MPDPIQNYRDMRFDERGRPYLVTASGQRSYVPPAMAAQYAGLFNEAAAANAIATFGPETVQRLRQFAQAGGVTPANPSGNVPRNTFASQNNGWNPDQGEYDTGMNWSGLGGAILGAAGLSVPLAVGPAIAGPAAGGASGAAAPAVAAPASNAAAAPASGLLPTSVPAGLKAAAQTTVGPSVTSLAPVGSVLPPAATTATNAAAGGWRGAANQALDNAGPLTALIGALAGGGGGGAQGGESDEVRRIQRITEARMRRADPLHQMMVQLAASRMPTSVQRPVPDVPLPE